ncbi:MAG: 50S ribosomal protein L25/general stress protein Ctc [Cyanobacteria bacterium J06638_22]
MDITVECKVRSEQEKPNALRRQGMIPAVLYGHKGTESVSLVLDGMKVKRLLKNAQLNNTVINLNVPDLPWSGKTVLREVQTHPWRTSDVYHLSFFSYAAHGKIDATLPLHFIGTPPGVKTDGGMLDTVYTELPIQGDPASIPEFIEVDVSQLEIGDSIQLQDLNLPSGVETQMDAETMIASVLQGRVSKEAGAEGEEAEVGDAS